MHLLKQSSKKIKSNKKRKVIPLLGTIQTYHSAKVKAEPEQKEVEVDQYGNINQSSLKESENQESEME